MASAEPDSGDVLRRERGCGKERRVARRRGVSGTERTHAALDLLDPVRDVEFVVAAVEPDEPRPVVGMGEPTVVG